MQEATVLSEDHDKKIWKMPDKGHLYEVLIPLGKDNLLAIINFFFHDDNIEMITYNGQNQPIRVYHHQYGTCDTNVNLNETSAYNSAMQIAKLNNKRLDQSAPIMEGTFNEGVRINITIPPATPNTTLTIRRYRKSAITVLDLINDNVITSEAAAFLWCCIGRIGHPSNILFCGGAASGKTTNLNAFAMFIPTSERLVIIEDTQELHISNQNIVRMVSNPRIPPQLLLNNALAMRPNRIILGELKNVEAYSFVSAINSGYDGCMATMNANSSREAIDKLNAPPMNVQKSQLKNLNLLVSQRKLPNGKRHITEITEIAESFGEDLRFNKLFVWSPDDKKIIKTGVPSRLRTIKSEQAGITLKDFDAILEKRKQLLEQMIKEDINADNFQAHVSSL